MREHIDHVDEAVGARSLALIVDFLLKLRPVALAGRLFKNSEFLSHEYRNSRQC